MRGEYNDQVHSPSGEVVAEQPGPSPSLGERDLYTILAYIGIGAIGVTNGLVLLIVPEPSHWWHTLPATILIVAALGPWLAAWGLIRARARRADRARRRHADVFRGRHLGER